MDKIRLGLVGCGGMGTRHLYGLRELVQSPFSNVELCAVCDIRRENAELAALEAEKLMGRPSRGFHRLRGDDPHRAQPRRRRRGHGIRRCITTLCVKH